MRWLRGVDEILFIVVIILFLVVICKFSLCVKSEIIVILIVLNWSLFFSDIFYYSVLEYVMFMLLSCVLYRFGNKNLDGYIGVFY